MDSGRLLVHKGFSNSGAVSECAEIFGDGNLLHSDSAYAKSQGFDDVIVPAVAVEVLAEVFLRSPQCTSISGFNANYNYAGHSFSFTNPLNVGRQLFFELQSRDGKNCLNGYDDTGKQIFTSEVVSGNCLEYKVPAKVNLIRRSRFEIDERQERVIDNFTYSAEFSYYPRIFGNLNWTHVASLIPRALLDESEARTGRKTGVYGGIRLGFHGLPKLGEFDVALYMRGRARQSGNGRFNYIFHGLISQNNNPVLSADFLGQHEVDLSAKDLL